MCRCRCICMCSISGYALYTWIDKPQTLYTMEAMRLSLAHLWPDWLVSYESSLGKLCDARFSLDKLNNFTSHKSIKLQPPQTLVSCLLSQTDNTIMTYCNEHVDVFRPGIVESRMYTCIRICITQLHASETTCQLSKLFHSSTGVAYNNLLCRQHARRWVIAHVTVHHCLIMLWTTSSIHSMVYTGDPHGDNAIIMATRWGTERTELACVTEGQRAICHAVSAEGKSYDPRAGGWLCLSDLP